jgi:hypothetical protein
MTRNEEIEGIALTALQLSQYLFMHLVDRKIIDPTGAEPQKKAAEIFELLRQGLGRPATTPSSL